MKMTTNYSLDEYGRATAGSSSDQRTVIKYIASRVVGHNLSTHLPQSLFCFPWVSLSPNVAVPASTTSVGLASSGHTPNFTTISAIHSINGERFIDELRELSRLNEILGNVILQCCLLETHIRAQQLQMEWLLTHQNQNSSIIELTYRSEIDDAKKLLQDKLALKGSLEKQCKDILAAIETNEERYHQILNRKNTFAQELFNLDRQITQTDCEAQFLQRRIRYLDDESNFYITKNQALLARKTRLRCELDQENLAQQALRAELEILEGQKITREDVHSSALDEAQKNIDVSQLPTMQASKALQEHLTQEVVRVRKEFETKIQSYREELHRKFELSLHHYQIHKAYPVPMVTKEHESKLEQYNKERQDISQQMACVRGTIDEIKFQIQSLENQIAVEKSSQQAPTNIEKSLAVMHGVIAARERQLEEVLRNRQILKKQIDVYREKMDRYPKQMTQTNYNQRTSVPEFPGRTIPIDSPSKKDPRNVSGGGVISLSLQYSKSGVGSTNLPVEFGKKSSLDKSENPWKGGTLFQYANFNVEQDCADLHRLLTHPNIDEFGIIRIVCNRSVDQRVQLRDRYRIIYNQNLGENMEMITNHSLNKLLRILLLSAAEHDCYELRRILKESQAEEKILLEIFFTRSSKHMRMVKETYQRLFNTTLEQDIISDRPKPSKRIVLTLFQTTRFDDIGLDEQIIKRDAQDLIDIGARWRSEEARFLGLLCSRSNSQLKQIFAAYRQMSGTNIEEAIRLHIDGTLYECYVTIIRIIQNQSRFFAYELQKSLQREATNEDNLNRIIVSRCEIDMVQIKIEYETIAKRTLYTHIQADVNGNYKLALLELLRQRVDSTSQESLFSQTQGVTDSPKHGANHRRNVQWRQPVSGDSSDALSNRSLTRSYSDRPIQDGRRFGYTPERTRNSMTDVSDRLVRIEENTVQQTNTRLTKIRVTERHGFTPMPSMPENYVGLSHTQ